MNHPIYADHDPDQVFPPLGSQKLTSANAREGVLLWLQFSSLLYLVTDVDLDRQRLRVLRVAGPFDQGTWVSMKVGSYDHLTFTKYAWVVG